jgi:hypothetical protein
MQQLIVPYIAIDTVDNYRLTEEISVLLDGYAAQSINNAPWAEDTSSTDATFSMAYNQDFIFLKYYVTEPATKAEYIKRNDPVYKDSCVEFFIAFDNDERYYNLEFNCVGNCLAQYGAGKTHRANLPARAVKQIQHQTSIKANIGGYLVKWELTLCIPKTIFSYHPQLDLQQVKARVNFYKCGDDLSQPHYLCWNRIEAEAPDFHLSRFFKEISFHQQAQYI